ncbi:hypothetical protein [Bacillus cereus group sp. BfR-BA-01523]|uniref:hypothetical protein n=1 Tax=Bacillus cereus group sp. BfR-BA-01523 TaxID=2920371 RepID=UPI001F56AF4E|nr:hypothetical protein [Bacillus cereus group sp. BfR-BA-01523]
MKKRLSLILAVALGIGSLTACGDAEKTTKNEAKQASTNEKKTTENKETPTKRTVDITPERYPWRFASIDIIKDWQSKGETVYLWYDANALEEYIANEITRDNKHKQEDLPKSAEYVQLFVDEVKKTNPEQKEYFNKLTEVVSDMKAVNLDGAKTKIEEAKKLREAK